MRHVAYVPHPGWEVLLTSGMRRYPQCAREAVRLIVPPALRQWLPFLAHLKAQQFFPYITSN